LPRTRSGGCLDEQETRAAAATGRRGDEAARLGDERREEMGTRGCGKWIRGEEGKKEKRKKKKRRGEKKKRKKKRKKIKGAI